MVVDACHAFIIRQILAFHIGKRNKTVSEEVLMEKLPKKLIKVLFTQISSQFTVEVTQHSVVAKIWKGKLH
jgi:hypothetical protein